MERTPRPTKEPATAVPTRSLTVILLLFGLIFLFMSLQQLMMLVHHWRTSSWVDLFAEGVVWLSIFGVSVAMILYPVRHVRAINLVIQFAIWPLRVLAMAGYYYTFVAAPIIALIFVIFTPALLLSALQVLGVVPELGEKAILYIAFVVASLVFTYWGDRLVAFVIVRWLQRKEDYSKLFAALRPQLARLYTYGIMATAYVAANVERFSNASLTSPHLWVAYKDVLVEVLLTFVAVDSAIDIWREFRGGAGE